MFRTRTGKEINQKVLSQLSEADRMFLGELDAEWDGIRRRRLFWSIIHNARDCVVFLVTLPALPIVWIIQAIKGEN